MTEGSAAMRARMREISQKTISIGWFPGNDYSDSGTPVAMIAYFNEVGGSRTLKNGNTLTLPARAPMRTTMNDKGNEIHARLGAFVNKAMVSGKVDECLNQFGAVTAEDFKESINKGGTGERNAEATINGMILKYDKDGNPVRAGSKAAKEARTFGQGKGKDAPLVDTGRMMNTLTWKVD